MYENRTYGLHVALKSILNTLEWGSLTLAPMTFSRLLLVNFIFETGNKCYTCSLHNFQEN